MPVNRPRYLMGVGLPKDLFEAVSQGVDMFDCVVPTRNGRNATVYTRHGKLLLRGASYTKDFRPIEENCPCYTCRTFSAAYLHHLFNARELLAYRLATIHNLSFISRLMGEIRETILNNTFAAFKQDFLANYKPTDEQTRLKQKEKWLKTRESSN